jgi:hypothetical protein
MMMTPRLLLAPLLAVATCCHGQCTTTIPADAVIVDAESPQFVSGSDLNYWVCPDASGTILTGDNNHIWIEAGAYVSAGGDYNTIHYRGLVTFGLLGDFNTCYAENDGPVQNMGQSNAVIICGMGQLAYAYDSAPAIGCGGVGVAEEAGAGSGMYPNPTSGELTIMTQSATALQLRITDLHGRELLQRPLDRSPRSSVDVSALASGLYVAWVVTSDGVVLRRPFVKD